MAGMPAGRRARSGAGAGAAEVRLRRALESAAAQWRTTFDAIDSPVLLFDLDGHVTRLNRAALQLTGLTYSDVLGRRADEVDGGELWRQAAALAAAVSGSHAPRSAEVRDPAGRRWDVTALLRGVDPEAPDEQVVVVARDVTRLIELQESLRHSEVMSALGSLVAGVAHQVRSPLFGLQAAVDAFEARYGGADGVRRYTDAMREPMRRLAELMRDLLDYARPASARALPGALDEVVARSLDACGPLAAERGVDLQSRLETGTVLMVAARLQQVFDNVIENAIQHSPWGAAVEVEAGPAPADGAWIEVRVRDHGAGFSPADLPRLPEPFFSRRPGGTGLGLAIVQRIVEESGGRLSFANAAGGGALVTIDLPRCSR
jgi:PAS domain S-box-containing protein